MDRSIIITVILFVIISCSSQDRKKKVESIPVIDSIAVEDLAIKNSDQYPVDSNSVERWKKDTTSVGRTLNEVKKILSRKDFNKLQFYVENPSDGYKRFPVWTSLRDLTTGYQEGIFYIEKAIPHKDNPGISNVYTFRVVFIATDKKLIYYELGEKKYKNKEDFYFTSIDKYKNEIEYNNLNNAFKQAYLIDLDEKELFIENIIYGEHCGNGGINPKEKDQIDEFVKSKDRNNLLKWLQSTNTEKQVYAVDGFFQLNNLGVKLIEQEMNMIKSILNKKGTIRVCYGCNLVNVDLEEVTKKFKF